MYFSHFTAYMLQNRHNVPSAFWNEIRREGLARLRDRMSQGRADSELCFRDLIEKVEAKIV